MKIHYPQLHYTKTHRGQLFPLLKAFIKGSGFTDAERLKMYQISAHEVEFVEEAQDADYCILSMSWNYYVNSDQMELAQNYIKKANAVGKQVWTWTSGDFGVDLNFKADYKVFRMSGHRSQLDVHHIGLPVFISDPLQNYYQTSDVILPDYSQQPIVGFCGQADASLSKTLKEIAIRLRHWLKFKFNKTKVSPQPIQSTSRMRAKLLQTLEKDKRIDSHFIKRKKYRAGVQHNKSKHQTTLEFYDNIQESQYVVCVRGGGNFSVRFYETLAMGRIPILVNTDCLLPLANTIDWKKHCVWVEENDQQLIAQRVFDFHQQHNQTSLEDLMQMNRKLWEDNLRIGSFFKSFYNS